VKSIYFEPPFHIIVKL